MQRVGINVQTPILYVRVFLCKLIPILFCTTYTSLLCMKFPILYEAFRYQASYIKQDVGMGLCQYVDLGFHALSLPCFHTFWHAIPTSFFFKSCFCTFQLELDLSLSILSVTTTPELKMALAV